MPAASRSHLIGERSSDVGPSGRSEACTAGSVSNNPVLDSKSWPPATTSCRTPATRDLFERCPDGIVVVRGDRILAANRAAADILGGPAGLVNRSLVELTSTASRQPLTDWLSAISAGSARTAPATSRSNKRDGSVTVAELSGARLQDASVQIAVRDVTARRRADGAVRVSEERLTLAFAGAQEGVWDWNLETGAVVYSPRWKQMLGYADEEVEPHVRAWERLLHPDDLPRARQVNERVMHGGGDYELEVRLRHKAGHYIDVLSRGYPVRRIPAGPVVRIVGTHLDLTDRKRAEADAPRKRGAVDAGVCRGAGRRLGLESGHQRGRVLATVDADARLFGRRDRAARERVGATRPS